MNNFLITIDKVVIHKDLTEQDAISWFEFHKSNALYSQTDEVIQIETEDEIIDTWNYSDWLAAERENEMASQGESHYYESKYGE